MPMRRGWSALRQFSIVIWNELFRTRAFVVAAALSFYFLLSLVPLIIVFSSLLGYLPLPNVFGKLLDLMATFVPPDAMALVQKIVTSVLTPHRGGLLSFGVLGYLWSSSGGFSAMIEALNIANDVEISRSWWRDRMQALLLTFTTGGLLLLSLLLIAVGPSFGHMMTLVFPVPPSFGKLWRTFHFLITFITFLLAILLLYLLGPNKKMKFVKELPGAVLAVVGWFAGSFGFSFYLRHVSNYNATYGSLGAVIVLLLWFYIVSIAILTGAEVNAELAKRIARGRLRPHGDPDPMCGPFPGVPSA